MAEFFLVGNKVTAKAPPSKTYTLLTSVHNDVDNVDDCSRVIGISKCEKNFANTQTHPHTYIQTDILT